MLQPYLLIGEIVRPQGLRGEVKVRHYTDDPRRFGELPLAYTETDGKYTPLEILGYRVHKENVYLALKGVTSRDQAESLRGARLYVDRAHARALDGDRVFIADILGATAYDTNGNALGTLTDVLAPGGADVFVFDTPKGPLLVPALKTVLLALDAENGRIVLDEQKLHEVAVYEHCDPDAVPGDA